MITLQAFYETIRRFNNEFKIRYCDLHEDDYYFIKNMLNKDTLLSFNYCKIEFFCIRYNLNIGKNHINKIYFNGTKLEEKIMDILTDNDFIIKNIIQ